MLLHREHVLIPSTLQKRILKDFHAGHLGITRMKSLMCSFVYKPNIEKTLKMRSNYVKAVP